MSDNKKEKRNGSAHEPPTVIYTAAGCVNSACVIQLFQSQHIPFKQIDTTKNEEVINELLTKHGKSYVPLVFHLGEYVGDAEAILLLHRQGQLFKKLKIDENTKSNGEKSSEVENLPIDALKQKFMQLDLLYKAMKDPANGVPIKNRFVNYKTFKGRTLIKWLAAHLKTSDDEAMKKAYEFFAGGYFHAIKTGTNFKNDNSLYRFKEDDDKKVLNAWRVDVSEEQKPVELATKLRQLMYKILSKNVTADFKNIDYPEINTSKEFWFYLQSALSLQSLDLTTLREMDRVTFFLDILYCIIMHVNIAYGLPTNTNLVSFWDYYGDYSYNIDGTNYSVSDIINVQLRGKRPLREKDKDKNKDYELGEISEKRIHFAIMSYFPMRTWSPPIMFYSPETLSLGLQCAARVFCERQIGMDVKAQTVALPRMFERYKEDFGATDLEVLEYISEFISGERQQQFKFLLQGRSSLIRIKYHDDPNVFNVEDNILEGENVDQEEVAKVMSRRIQKHQSEAEGSSSLSLDRLHSERLSNELFGLVHLTELDLSRNKLDKLPTEFAQLNKLRFLNMNSNRLRTLENFPTLNLEVLELADNLLQTIPVVFCQSMTTLRSLSLESNQLQKLPKEFAHLQKLEEIYLQSNQFTRIPSTLGKLPNLAVLELSLNKVKDLDRLETLTRLEELYLHDQTQFVLDEAGAAKFANLPYLEVLDLSKNGLYELPRMMFAGLTSLEELYLQNNKITEIPPEICLLQNVIELDVKANPLRTPPLFICEMGIDEIISFYDRGNDNDGVGSESESISKMAKEEKKKRGGSFIKKLDFAGIFTKDKDKEGSEGKSPRGSRRSLNFSGNNNVNSNNDKLPERSESPSKKKITVSQTKPRSNTLDGSGPPSALSLSTGALFGKGQTIDSVIGEDDEVSPLTERDDVTRRGSMTSSPSRSPRKLSDLLRKSKKKTVTSDFKKIEDVKSHTQPLLAVSGLREKTMIVPVPGYYIEDPRGPMPKSYKLQEFLHLYDYQRYFYNTEHVNFVGVDQTIGPLVICISREPVEPSIDDPLRGVIPRKVCNYKTVPRREVRRNIAGNFSARVRSVAAIEAEKSIEDQTDKAKLFPSKFIYRALVRTKKGDFRVSIPLTMLKETKRRYIRPQSLLKGLQECFNQDESLFSWSVNFREAPPEKLPHDKLRDMEQKLKMNGYKFGVIYAKEGQFTDDDMFQNATGSPVFDEFLSMIGETIDLKGWQNYNAGLDVKGNTTGKHSVFTKFRDYEIMLHVSTLLPFNDEDTQQLERKRHIGNDIVVIIFIDGKSTFNPALIKSVFNHVFVVVSPVTNNNSNSKEQSYKVEIVSKEGVLASEPVLPNPPIFTRGPQFREYLLTKLINAERAAYLAKNFLGPIEWTRGNLLTELLEKEKS